MDNQFNEIEIFDGKSLSSLFKDIYDNHQGKKTQIKELITELYPLVEGIGDATLIIPLIKEYLEISVKNDEQLIKLAQIVQRLDATGKKGSSNSGDFDFSSLQDLLEEDAKMTKEVQQVQKEASDAIVANK